MGGSCGGVQSEPPGRLGLCEPRALGGPGMAGPAGKAEAIGIDRLGLWSPAEEERQRHEESGAGVRPSRGARREATPPLAVQIFGQHVDRFAEGRQQGQHLAGPAHLFRLVLLCGKHREWQDERICPSDDGSVEVAAGWRVVARLAMIIVDGPGENGVPVQGDPADPATVVGPLIESRPREAIRAAVQRAGAAGARVLTGARQPDGDGWFQAPTLLADVPPGDDLLSEEYFGPVCVVLPADSADAAARAANNVRHGLVAAVYTRDLGAALTLTNQLDVGMVKVNAPTTGVDFHAPFGGEKESSYGPREQGTAARDFYTRTVTVTLTP